MPIENLAFLGLTLAPIPTSNFQLIAIIHDEKFMQMLGSSDHAEYIWRVSKDEEGFSNLTRETIAHFVQ